MHVRVVVSLTYCGRMIGSLPSRDDVCSHDVVWGSWSALTLQRRRPAFLSERTPGHTSGINPVLNKDQFYDFFFFTK